MGKRRIIRWLYVSWITLCLCHFAAPVAAFAHDEPGEPGPSLTEAEALRMGVSREAVNELVAGMVGLAQAEGMEARIWPNPTLSYSREQINGGPSASSEDFGWVTQGFDVSGRRGLRTKAAEQRLGAARLRGESRRLEVQREIRFRFYEILLRQRRLQAVETWSQRMARIADTVARREAVGDISSYDRRRLEREAATALARHYVEHAARDSARERLAALLLLGEKDRPGKAWPQVLGELLPGEPPPIGDLIAAVSEKPDLLLLEKNAMATELEQRAAGRWWVPEVTLGGGLKSVDTEGDRSTGFLVMASIPFPVLNRGEAEALRATSQARITRGERRIRLAETMGEVHALWMQATQLTQAARRFRADAVGQSAELVRTAEAAYEAGELGILELIDAYRSAFDAETQVLELEMQARSVRIELDHATGGAAG